jgi:hypothetical protein
MDIVDSSAMISFPKVYTFSFLCPIHICLTPSGGLRPRILSPWKRVCQFVFLEVTYMSQYHMFMSLCFIHTSSGAHPASYSMSPWGCFPAGKTAGVWSWPLTYNYCRSQEYVDLFIYTPIHLHGIVLYKLSTGTCSCTCLLLANNRTWELDNWVQLTYHQPRSFHPKHTITVSQVNTTQRW